MIKYTCWSNVDSQFGNKSLGCEMITSRESANIEQKLGNDDFTGGKRVNC